jgi:uncharacterized membrane protein
VTAEKMTMAFGWRVYGLGVMAVGMACLAFGEFDSGQPVPENFPARTALAYAAGAFMVVAAAAVEWRRTAVWGAAALTAYYALIVVILMNGRLLLTNFAVFVTNENIAIQLAITAGGLIVYASTARIDAPLAARLTRLGRLAFGICALVFGGAHFVYMNLTAPLVPKWLPPTQEFWGYATGVCFVAAGVAILTVLRPTGTRADASGRSLDPLQLDRERRESRHDWRRLGGGGLAGAADTLAFRHAALKMDIDNAIYRKLSASPTRTSMRNEACAVSSRQLSLR